MATKRKKQHGQVNLNENKENFNIADFKDLIESKIEEEYGAYKDECKYIVPFNIRPLDAILGGGLAFGMISMITGPAETGKTTIAWQLIKSFLDKYQNGLALYIDIEGGANIDNKEIGIISRMDLLNIDKKRVIYKSLVLYIEQVFELIQQVIELKRKQEEKFNIEIPLLVVWDSIADTPVAKVDDVDSPNQLVGYRARILQYYFEKTKELYRRNNVLLFIIDQVRANISDAVNMYKKSEKGVGVFNDLKSATGSKAVEHKIRQWLFISKGQDIYDIPDIDGWYLTLFTEKCKLAPSKHAIKCVFDKRYGIDKFWTEFIFLSEYTPSEEKMFKKMSSSMVEKYKSSIPDFAIKQVGGGRFSLSITDPETGEVISYPKTFYKREAKELYEKDEKFREIFDKAVEIHVKERIIKQFNAQK